MTEGKVAFCFPGQGSQEVGMGRAMSEAVPAARAVYERAADAVGFDLAELCFEGPIERLSETEITQPALVSTELACLAGLTAAGLRPDYVVGHSVGEYAALAAAGSIDDRTAAHLTRERGLATAAAAAASPGAMAAVIGLDDSEIERLCDGIEGVWAANYNCPGQVVVSGTLAGVDALIAAAEAAGARRAVKLKVSGGFHSPLTALAAEQLAPVLEATTLRRAGGAVLLDRHLPPRGRARDRADPAAAADRARALHAGRGRAARPRRADVHRDRPRQRALGAHPAHRPQPLVRLGVRTR